MEVVVPSVGDCVATLVFEMGHCRSENVNEAQLREQQEPEAVPVSSSYEQLVQVLVAVCQGMGKDCQGAHVDVLVKGVELESGRRADVEVEVRNSDLGHKDYRLGPPHHHQVQGSR